MHWTAGNRRAAIAITLGVLFAFPHPLWADSWSAPEPRTVRSPNGAWTASMTPGKTGGPNAKIVVSPNHRAHGLDGWTRTLVNSKAPVDLFVSDIGSVATLGDWHNEGDKHAIVLYDARGKVVIDQTLEDFLTPDELERTERSVSSRSWRYHGETPEFIGEEFSLSTLWGTALRFDTRTGRVTREPESFPRFRRYCDGTRTARDAVIFISRVWKKGDSSTGWHCEVRRGGATCQPGAERYRPSHAGTKIAMKPRQFEHLVTTATTLVPYIGDHGWYDYDKSFIHLQFGFGESIARDEWGSPKGGDIYWLKFKPTEASPAARDWMKRLESLVRAP